MVWIYHSLVTCWRTFWLFPIWPLWIKLLWTFMFRFLCGCKFSFFCECNCWVMWLSTCFVCVFVFLFLEDIAKLFSGISVPLYIPTSNVWEIHFLHILASVWYCYYFYFICFNNVWWYLIADLSRISPMASDT